MKKFLIGFVIFIALALVLLTQFGVQVGNVRIGKQMDLKTKQNFNFEESAFYKTNFLNKNLIVLNLWATWCVPCVEELPELNEIKEQYKNDKIDFISISVDNDSIKLINFINKGKFKFNDVTISNLAYRNSILNTLENRKPEEWISSYSVPVTYLIKNRKVIAKIDGQIEKTELMNLINENK